MRGRESGRVIGDPHKCVCVCVCGCVCVCVWERELAICGRILQVSHFTFLPFCPLGPPRDSVSMRSYSQQSSLCTRKYFSVLAERTVE